MPTAPRKGDLVTLDSRKKGQDRPVYKVDFVGWFLQDAHDAEDEDTRFAPAKEVGRAAVFYQHQHSRG